MRLIDLDSPRIKDLNGFEEKFMGETVLEWLDNMPTVDAVEVVRCKDCRYWWEEERQCKDEMGFARHWNADDYCSNGERR